MKLSDAIKKFEQLKTKYGDIIVECECPHCTKLFVCDLVVMAPVVRLMKGERNEEE